MGLRAASGASRYSIVGKMFGSVRHQPSLSWAVLRREIKSSPWGLIRGSGGKVGRSIRYFRVAFGLWSGRPH
jgi:hypothetical protein